MRSALHLSCRAGVVAAALLVAHSSRPLAARPQLPTPTPASDVAQSANDADQLMARFLATADTYEKTFRNLVAEETKLIEVFKASGELEKRREIRSDLLVYRSSRPGSEATVEYRDVRSVDGKAVQKRGERVLKLLETASNAASIEKELQAVDRETRRYEFNRHVVGLTIQQRGVLRNRTAAFQIAVTGREQIDGHDVVVLEYRQTGPIPGFRMPVARGLGNPTPLHTGRLWIDAETGQLWRRVWELAVPHPAAPEPLVILREEGVYAPSRFGILVPERIVFDWRMRFSHPKKGQPSLSLSERMTLTYGAFKRFDVATSEALAETPDQ